MRQPATGRVRANIVVASEDSGVPVGTEVVTYTGWQAYAPSPSCGPGSSVLVSAATGAVAVQLAKAAGARDAGGTSSQS